MTRRYDLMVIDLDGTMLGRDGGVSQRNRAAIAETRRPGHELTTETRKRGDRNRR